MELNVCEARTKFNNKKGGYTECGLSKGMKTPDGVVKWVKVKRVKKNGEYIKLKICNICYENGYY